jgi:ferric-dicitrate binding protein FerR (iron transport regulator)
MTHPLDNLIAEAREGLGVREAEKVDWQSVDEGLFARIAAERHAERARFAPGRERAWAITGAAALAAAGVVAIVAARSGHEPVPVASPAPADEALASIVRVEGEGLALVGSAVAGRGSPIQLNDTIEAAGGDVLVERAGKLRFLLEKGSMARVTHGQGGRGPLVLALERGAVEADVVPVATGEAFAVDVGPSRVAVHGTHLRVSRDEEHGRIDLSEGVVAVGDAPRAGPVLGAIVTAPAHVEFLASDARGTLRVAHDAASLRAPVDLGAVATVVPTASAEGAASDRAASSRGEAAARSTGPTAIARAPESHPASSFSPSSAPATSPEQTLANAVWACMAGRPRAENVTVLVSTTLHLDVGDDGTVKSARFEPPVVPDVNECASRWIYKMHFAHPGPLAIGIDFRN